MKKIMFYDPRFENGFLSNFYKSSFRLDDTEWNSSEHYYQAKKYLGTKYELQIQCAASPSIAASIGRNPSLPIRDDWEDVKVKVMENAIIAKFSQNKELRKLLTETGEAEIIEHTSKDGFWGDAGDGSGKNMLGKVLMRVRDGFSTGFVT